MNPGKIDISSITVESLRKKEYSDAFPEYYELAAVTENNLWHDHQNVLEHVISVFEELLKYLSRTQGALERYLSEFIGNKSRKDILIIATLLHDIAKIDTFIEKPDGTTQSPGHELAAASRVKRFSERFDLNKKDEECVERIVRYHGFINDVLSLIIANRDRQKYFEIFKETVGDVAIELTLLMYADLLGSDLERRDKKSYDNRMDALLWVRDKMLFELR